MSFNGSLREAPLDGEIFFTLEEARIVIEWYRLEYNHIRPHSSLDYRPPAPEAILPLGGRLRSATPAPPPGSARAGIRRSILMP